MPEQGIHKAPLREARDRNDIRGQKCPRLRRSRLCSEPLGRAIDEFVARETGGAPLRPLFCSMLFRRSVRQRRREQHFPISLTTMKNPGEKMNRSLASALIALIACAITDAVPAKQPLPASSASKQIAKATCTNPIGQWKNQMGSTLNLKTVDTTTGALSGEYQTATGASGAFPLTGWVNELPADANHDNARIISFVVRWNGLGSITAWTGTCRGTDQLNTVWQLGRANSGFEWDHVLSGADQFVPI